MERESGGSGLLLLVATLAAMASGFWILDARQVEREQKKKNDEESARQLAPLKVAIERHERLERLERSGGKLSLSAYGQLQQGMSYNEACRILESSGAPTASSVIAGAPAANSYVWSSGVVVVTCIFLDDKLVAKSQAGLQ